MPLTPKQARFVAAYLINPNGKQAAIEAGCSSRSAESTASRWLRNAKVREALDKANAKRAERLELKADDVLRELLRIAMVDVGDAFTPAGQLKSLHEMPADVRRAIAGIDVDELWGANAEGDGRAQIGNTRKVKFWSKPQALELLGKHLKLWTERHEHSGDGGGPVVFRVVKRGE